MSTDQLTGYWDTVNQQFQGPGNVPSASWENVSGGQLVAATGSVALGFAPKAGVIKSVRVGAIAAPIGVATYTVDIKKNNVSVLTGVVTLDNSYTARASKNGVLVAPANLVVAAGDFFEAVIVSTPGGGTAPVNTVFQVDMLCN
jgi:hypothetical protein